MMKERRRSAVMALVNALLICVLCGVGLRTFAKRRKTAKKQWFAKLDSPSKKVRVPFFTRVYVVRCWQEHTRRDHEIVMRYALDSPTTGQRCGFTSAEALLDTLSVELTSAQAAQPQVR
jgi:hypothetical protein